MRYQDPQVIASKRDRRDADQLVDALRQAFESDLPHCRFDVRAFESRSGRHFNVRIWKAAKVSADQIAQSMRIISFVRGWNVGRMSR